MSQSLEDARLKESGLRAEISEGGNAAQDFLSSGMLMDLLLRREGS